MITAKMRRRTAARHEMGDDVAGQIAILRGAPATDGWSSLSAAARVNQERPDVPLIFLTGDSSEELAIAALRARAREYLKHPVSTADIAAAVIRRLAPIPAVNRDGRNW